jgi:pSer/pThr/pTyr-binding forkhead associated (FHA) protein
LKITLEVMSGAMDGQEFRFSKSVAIGRDKTSEIPLNLDKYISRKHARLIVNEPEVVLEDLGSTNGTFLRDERVTRRETLQNNELFRVGRTWVKLVW